MSDLATIPPNPATLGYPATLPLELAMRTASVRDLCTEYGLSKEDWEELRLNPLFQADLRAAVEMLRKDGMSFKIRARLQSEELLKTSWKMIHDVLAPFAVRADMIKFTVRVAGLDTNPKDGAVGLGNFNIQINLG